MDLVSFQKLFNERYFKVIDERIDRAVSIIGDETLATNIRQLGVIARGGKRLRPYLVYAVYEALGGKNPELALEVGVGIELFHLFCLVHDDVIDRATTRHGAHTVQAVAIAGANVSALAAHHNADSQAILAGDLVFSWAYEQIVASLVGLPTADTSRQVFSRMIDEVVAGQMIDVALLIREATSSEVIERKLLLKTATYTFTRPLELATVLAGGDVVIRQACEEFGAALGSAFQIQDDLFDIVLTSEAAGKPVMNDIREGQQTTITAHFFATASVADQAAFKEYFGQSFEASAEEDVRGLLERAGSLEESRRACAGYFAAARAAAAASGLPEPVSTFFINLVSLVEGRRK